MTRPSAQQKNDVIEKVRHILSRLKDPLSHKSLLEAGLIEGFSFDQNRLSFAFHVPESAITKYEPLRSEVEKTLRKGAPDLNIFVGITAHKSLQKGVSETPASSPRSKMFSLPQIKHVVAVASGKGGVGKSTVSLNLALALKNLGLKVGLLDLDIYGPSLPLMTGLQGPLKTTDDKKLTPLEFHGMPVMSMGFLIPSASPVIWRGPMIQSGVRQLFMDVNWPALDILVLDLPPGTGDTQLTLAQKAPLSGAIIVSTPQDLALADARKAISMFQKLEIPLWGLIENMSTYVCPHCQKESHPFSHQEAQQTAQDTRIPFLGTLPLSPTILQGTKSQRTLFDQEGLPPEGIIFKNMATKMIERLC